MADTIGGICAVIVAMQYLYDIYSYCSESFINFLNPLNFIVAAIYTLSHGYIWGLLIISGIAYFISEHKN